MGFTRSTTDIKVHQKLSDYPSVEDGLSAEELKKRFDSPAEQLQKDLNKLEEELEDIEASQNIGAKTLDASDESENTVQAKLEMLREDIQNTTLGQISNGTITREKLNSEYADSLAEKNGELQENLNSNYLEGKTVNDILDDAENNKPYVVGTYTGNDTNGRTIDLGFTPQAVMLNAQNSTYLWYGALAITGSSKKDSNKIILSIVENGFTVSVGSSEASNSNKSGQVYHYIAFK